MDVHVRACVCMCACMHVCACRCGGARVHACVQVRVQEGWECGRMPQKRSCQVQAQSFDDCGYMQVTDQLLNAYFEPLPAAQELQLDDVQAGSKNVSKRSPHSRL